MAGALGLVARRRSISARMSGWAQSQDRDTLADRATVSIVITAPSFSGSAPCLDRFSAGEFMALPWCGDDVPAIFSTHPRIPLCRSRFRVR